MKLRPKPPFSFDLTATHMYLMPPARYSDGVFSRILRLESGRLVHISVTASGPVDNPELSISVEPRTSEEDEREIKEKVSFMFSIDEDLTEFYSSTKNDPILKYAIENLYGLKVQTTPTLFEGLVIGFCLQWVSFERGVKMMDRLIRRYGERVNDYYAFPTSQALAEARLEELQGCKLGFRAERVKWISEKTAEGLNLEGLKSLPDDQLRES